MGVRSKYQGTKFYIQTLRRDPCVFCGNYYKLPLKHKKAGKRHNTIDHIHPKARGGGNHWMNYAATCPLCNSVKGSNSLLGHLMGVSFMSSRNTMVPGPGLEEMWYMPLDLRSSPGSVIIKV